MTNRSQGKKAKRMSGEIADTYDAIIVGAGIGGLTTATLLARAGLRVLVLDQHYVAGGNVTSFRRGSWTFDVGLHYVGECGQNERFQRILKACGINMRFYQMSADLEKIVFPDFHFTIPSTKREFYRCLIERFPEERSGIERYFKFLDQFERVITSIESGSTLKQIANMITSPLLLRYLNKTAGDLFESCTSNPRLKAIFNARSFTYTVASTRVSAILYAGLQNHYLISGGWYPEGGGQKISDRMVEEIEACGSDIRLHSTVRSINVSKGRVTGVIYNNKKKGEHHVSAPIIVSNADIKRTVFNLVGREHFPSRFVRKIEQFEMALPLFIVYIGIDTPPEEFSFSNSNQWLVNNLDTDADFEKLERGEMPDEPNIYISTPSPKSPMNQNTTSSSHTSIQVMTMVPSNASFWGITEEEIASGSYSKNANYLRVKKRITDLCVDQAARIIPNLREDIAFLEAASPMTHTRYTGSTHGTGYGFAALPSQFLRHRPGAKSPIRDLYFCGTNCRAGHGVIASMKSGVQAAEAILGNSLYKKVMDKS
ncbi:MAG: NAD(P)/FAD-dependent oxidoreductase [Proteobacteria bacterium]|nr:NAD(P)/FAD-dependent oxidoreductase [Pseudomonadota bacterium]